MTVKGVLVFAVLCAVGALSLFTLPAPLDVAPDSGFDTDAAMKHLRFIAAEPRPVGSKHHRAVCEYLVQQFQSLGLETEVQETRFRARRMLRGLPIEVRNVVARLRGTAGTSRAVMLAAHYDSTPALAAASRGAGDDGAAVAALIEVARNLALDRPRNDIIFLITDAEELGLIGADAFVTEHRWKNDVAAVFNFEARGTSGPSIMFQTSTPNAWLIEHYSRAVPHPITSSLSQAVYSLMPNTTDFTIFQQHGLRGLDFAFIGDYANYHTAGDRIEHLDIRSMRHHGVQALALARHFGAIALDRDQVTRESIYFNVLWLGVVRYPQSWAVPLAISAVGFVLGAIVAGARFRSIGIRGVLWGLVVMLLGIAASVGIAILLVRVVPLAPLNRHASLSMAGFAVLALMVTMILLCLFQRRAHPLELATAGILVSAVLAVATANWLPGASYLLAWPTISAGIGLLICSALGRERWSSTLVAMVLLLTGIPNVLLLTPVTYLAFQGLRIQLAAVMVGWIVVGLWMLIPQLALLISTQQYPAPGEQDPQLPPHPPSLQNP